MISIAGMIRGINGLIIKIIFLNILRRKEEGERMAPIFSAGWASA
jgi:hypothetical protein